ncbi:hypothetical protein Dsin_014226 [Dipteronia sinensis]|uniref:RNase H type-1 domain-containing protein n=1 Tax=Dipteronia sinensis TaxID=43782 RepID=A0AAE0ALB9_9ROSI|nr:hypothetical protein Dsin_014226 [Dipteronia sinensis]
MSGRLRLGGGGHGLNYTGIIEATDQEGVSKVGKKGDSWQERDKGMINKSRVQQKYCQRRMKGDRLGWDVSDSENFVNCKGKEEVVVDKGKQAYVRKEKKRTSHPNCVNGKLEIEKINEVRSRTKSWTSSSDSDVEEGFLRNYGLQKGESSKVKSMGKRPKFVGPTVNYGQQREGYHSSQGDGPVKEQVTSSKNSDPESNPNRESPYNKRCVSKGPRQILVRHTNQRLVSFSDNDGRVVSLPLHRHVQLPICDTEGGQIRGKDLKAIPLAVEIDGTQSTRGRDNLQTKSAMPNWNLKAKIARVVEKGVALGHISKSKEKALRQKDGTRQNTQNVVSTGRLSGLKDVAGDQKGRARSDTWWMDTPQPQSERSFLEVVKEKSSDDPLSNNEARNITPTVLNMEESVMGNSEKSGQVADEDKLASKGEDGQKINNKSMGGKRSIVYALIVVGKMKVWGIETILVSSTWEREVRLLKEVAWKKKIMIVKTWVVVEDSNVVPKLGKGGVVQATTGRGVHSKVHIDSFVKSGEGIVLGGKKSDGSARGNPGEAGIGGVLRNNSSRILGLFLLYVGIKDSSLAEILAIHRAATLCSQSASLRNKEIDIVSDSSEAVSWVNTEGPGNLEFLNIIYETRHAMSLLGNTTVSYNPRSSNTLAYSLAKHGSARRGNKMIWDL